MPTFTLIGFCIPAFLSTIYFYRALKSLPLLVSAVFLISGILTYQFPFTPSGPVHLRPFYLIISITALISILLNNQFFKKFHLPMAPLMSYGFFSVVIPDFILTWQRFNEKGTVGAANWEDGIIKWWLYPFLILVILAILLELVQQKSNKKTVSLIRAIEYHASPIHCTSNSQVI